MYSLEKAMLRRSWSKLMYKDVRSPTKNLRGLCWAGLDKVSDFPKHIYVFMIKLLVPYRLAGGTLSLLAVCLSVTIRG